MADFEKASAAAKTTPKSRGKKHITTDDKPAVVVETELAIARAAHARLIDISIQSKGDASRTKAGLEVSKTRSGKVEQKAKLAVLTWMSLGSIRKSGLKPQRKRYVSGRRCCVDFSSLRKRSVPKSRR